MMFNNEKTKDMTVEEKVKDILNKRKEELEKEKIYRKELYNRMVKEAVLVIEEMWEKDAEYVGNLDTNVVIAKDAFFVEQDTLALYSMNWHFTVNPDTDRSCFYDHFEFESQAEVEKYVEDVKACLPPNIKVNVTEDAHNKFYDMGNGKCFYYTFTLELNE